MWNENHILFTNCRIVVISLFYIPSYLHVGHCQCTNVPRVSGSTVMLHCNVCLVFTNKQNGDEEVHLNVSKDKKVKGVYST